MTASPAIQVVQSFSNPTGTSPGFTLPGGFYSMIATGDGSDDTNNNPPTITVNLGTTILATLSHCAAGTNSSTGIPGLRIPPVGYDYAQFFAPDNGGQLTVVVTPGANGAVPREVQIIG
jgi:hypothetical protein